MNNSESKESSSNKLFSPKNFFLESERGEIYVSPPGARKCKDGVWRPGHVPTPVELMETFSWIEDDNRGIALSISASLALSIPLNQEQRLLLRQTTYWKDCLNYWLEVGKPSEIRAKLKGPKKDFFLWMDSQAGKLAMSREGELGNRDIGLEDLFPIWEEWHISWKDLNPMELQSEVTVGDVEKRFPTLEDAQAAEEKLKFSKGERAALLKKLLEVTDK